MKTTKSTRPTRLPGLLFFAALLAIILSVVFWKSFLPHEVVFSNDGPLGMQKSAWLQLPQSITGAWCDLNSIGYNAGAFAPGPTTLIRWGLGPVGFAKFLAPLAVFILGLGAWTFFRQLRLSPLAAILGGLAAALNSTFFSTACWGVAQQEIAIGMDFFALALIVSNSLETPAFLRWTRLALAGLAVGVNVIEGADIGAIFSLFVAIFVVFKALMEPNTPVLKKIGLGVGRVVLVAVFAGFIAAQTVVALVNSQITGIAGTAQTAEVKAQHWDWATQWSLPKVETLSVFVPGLFGCRMDTPDGGNYWGAIGRDPAWDRYFANGSQGTPPQGFLRFSGGGSYAGILVVLVAFWAIAQSLRRRNPAFPDAQRRFICFWAIILVVCLLLAYGRFAPFYQLLYMLPYFSTIRNPAKFLNVFSWALVILFGYGIHGLSRLYLEVPKPSSSVPFFTQIKNWRAKVRGFDRHWTSGCIVAVIASVLAWLIYAAEKPSLIKYLQAVGFPDESTAQQIAAFSLGQAGWFVLFFALAAGLFLCVIAGIFSGKKARLGGILLGIFLVVDLGRANLPYIVYWNYIQKDDVDPANTANSTNPVINFLRNKPYEHRVAILPFNFPQQYGLFESMYKIEWAQHQFSYYNIQSLDVIQMPRTPADLDAFHAALAFDPPIRRWELTNTRYLLGPAGFLDPLNEQLDPVQHRFHIVQRFNIVPKPGVNIQELQTELEHNEFHGEKFTAVLASNGDYAVFDFTGALPRAKLYSDWKVGTNDPAILQHWVNSLQQRLPKEMGDALAQCDPVDRATLYDLAGTNFDAWKSVLLSAPLPVTPTDTTNQNPGSVEFKSYAPKDIVLQAQAAVPSVLLLNDKYDPNWRVSVDGQPAKLLRCNFIMQGVFLPAGKHTVEFQFKFPNGPLYVTLSAITVAIVLCGLLPGLTRNKTASTAKK